MPPPSSTWWEVTPVDRSEQPTEQAKNHHPGNRPDPLPPPATGGGLRLQGPGKGGGQAGTGENAGTEGMEEVTPVDQEINSPGAGGTGVEG